LQRAHFCDARGEFALLRDGDGAFDGVCLREQRFDFGDDAVLAPDQREIDAVETHAIHFPVREIAVACTHPTERI
jgi:hypothetical protein